MPQSRPQPLCGFLNLNKSSGPTSRRALDCVGRLAPGVKVGHAGTLDPLASGVLVVCLGATTRLVDFVQGMTKVYQTTIRLGARSDSLDAEGQVVPTPDPPVPTEAQVRMAVQGQVGTIAQVPPQVSALKVGGRRAYDLARQGKRVELEARPVTVHRIDLREYRWPSLRLEVECSGGTYIRAIARDLGEALGCGGLVQALERTRIGPFRLEDAVRVEDLTRETFAAQLRPALEAVGHLPQVRLAAAELKPLVQGQPLSAAEADRRALAPGPVALVDPAGALVAIAEHDPSAARLLPRRVLFRP